MALISKPFTFSAGAVIIASQHNSCFDTVYNLVNGALDTTNLASNAAIVDTQLAQITTAGKVSTTALTVASQATGDIIYAASATTWARLGIGTSAQVLIGGTIPAWSTPPVPAYTDGADTSTADETTSSATYADTTLSITATPGKAGLAYVTFIGPSDTAGGAGKLGYALNIDGAVVADVVFRSNSSGLEYPVYLSWFGAMAASAHTVKVQFKTASGTETLLGSTYSTARLFWSYLT